ncbi:MAG: amidohydrolase family protein [Candidatus Marinimicrobia bacterium]|nr:amidohydrolase family protein [Candidatus Neomarinimicrobiota bacterium]
MNQILLSNLRIMNPFGKPKYLENASILIQDGLIRSVGDLPAGYTGERIDMAGKTVLPGMINAHNHLYSTLALGMPAPKKSPGNFVEILKEIWWKLDLSLDEASTKASFEAGLLDCLLNGVTTVIDHHASPNYITGALDLLVETAKKFGITLGICFEASDRNGESNFKAELSENIAAMIKYDSDPNVLPLLGLHASFTLSDASLQQAAEALKGLENGGIHIHVAEDLADERDALERGYDSVIQRLDHFGLLNNRSLIIHGVYITRQDRHTMLKRGCNLIHNPSSNAGNQVGILETEIIDSMNAGLGTDGKQNNMIAEAKEGIHIRAGKGSEPVDYLKLLFKNNSAIVSQLFGKDIGHINIDSQADLVFYDYDPRTEVHAHNFMSHILYGLKAPSDVMTRGIFRMRARELSEIDVETIHQNSRHESMRLWEKMQKL